MIRKFTLAAALAALAIPAAAQAPGANFMMQWDADESGAVTLDEVLSRRADTFAAYDENEDGFLDASELAALNTAGDDMRTAMHDDRPQGGQGKGQGQHKGQGKGQGMGHQQGQGNGQGHGPKQGMGQGSQNGQHDHAMLDTDGDGNVSLAEFEDNAKSWFQMRDRSGDGRLDTDDFGPRN